METKTARLSRTMACILMCGMGLLGAGSARAAGTTYNFQTASGNWNVANNWTPNTGIPGSADNVNINQGALVTVSDAEAASQLQIGNNGVPSGTLTVETGGILTLGTGGFYVGAVSGATGTVAIDGGTLNSAATINLGFGPGSTGTLTISGGTYNGAGLSIGASNAAGKGIMNQSGGMVSATNVSIGATSGTASSYSISGGTLHWSGVTNLITGAYTVMGSSALVAYNGSAGATATTFNVHASTTVDFVFDAAGVSAINLNNTELSVASGALLTIDGSGYSGGTSSITLFSGISTRTGTTFSSTISGFGPNYTEQLVYNPNSIVLQVTQVPEPGTVALLLVGGGVVCFAGRRRFLAIG